MRITIKLFAMLGQYLPNEHQGNVAVLEVADNSHVAAVLQQLGVPLSEVHLVLINGVYHAPQQLEQAVLKADDTLALWPPVAGG